MKTRVARFPIEPIILNRWSSRALSGESITEYEFMRLIEAARWAQSSFNNQPWRFLYALRDTPDWQMFFDLMIPFNQEWAQRAAALIVVVSHTLFEYNGKPSRTHSFDTGAATQTLALQGCAQGLVAHAIEGFDYEKAHKVLQIPDDYVVEAMVVVGKPGNKDLLSPELQAREEFTDRKETEAILYKGCWGSDKKP